MSMQCWNGNDDEEQAVEASACRMAMVLALAVAIGWVAAVLVVHWIGGDR